MKLDHGDDIIEAETQKAPTRRVKLAIKLSYEKAAAYRPVMVRLEVADLHDVSDDARFEVNNWTRPSANIVGVLFFVP